MESCLRLTGLAGSLVEIQNAKDLANTIIVSTEVMLRAFFKGENFLLISDNTSCV